MVSTGYFKIEGRENGFEVTEFIGPAGSSYTIVDSTVLFNTVNDENNQLNGLVTSSYLSGTTAFASLSLAYPTSKSSRFTILTSDGTGFNSFKVGNYAYITINRG